MNQSQGHAKLHELFDKAGGAFRLRCILYGLRISVPVHGASGMRAKASKGHNIPVHKLVFSELDISDLFELVEELMNGKLARPKAGVPADARILPLQPKHDSHFSGATRGNHSRDAAPLARNGIAATV